MNLMIWLDFPHTTISFKDGLKKERASVAGHIIKSYQEKISSEQQSREKFPCWSHRSEENGHTVSG